MVGIDVFAKSSGLTNTIGEFAAGTLLANTNYHAQDFLLIIMAVVFRMIVVYFSSPYCRLIHLSLFVDW